MQSQKLLPNNKQTNKNNKKIHRTEPPRLIKLSTRSYPWELVLKVVLYSQELILWLQQLALKTFLGCGWPWWFCWLMNLIRDYGLKKWEGQKRRLVLSNSSSKKRCVCFFLMTCPLFIYGPLQKAIRIVFQQSFLRVMLLVCGGVVCLCTVDFVVCILDMAPSLQQWKVKVNRNPRS